MITISRDESKVKLKIENGPLNSVYEFTYECGNRWYAELLRLHFTERLDNRIEEIRKIEYERGWNDHKKRNQKADWFYNSLTTNKYGK